MAKTCPHCGAITTSEARFCRLCGAPLKSAGEESGPVSPMAQTVPLAGEGRSTDGLAAEEPRRTASDTSRVGLTEMDELLRRSHERTHLPEPGVPVHTSAAPPFATGAPAKLASATSELKPTIAAAAPPPAPASLVPQAQSTTLQTTPPAARTRRVWPFIVVFLLLCFGLVAALTAFIVSRRHTSSAAVGTSANANIAQEQVAATEPTRTEEQQPPAALPQESALPPESQPAASPTASAKPSPSPRSNAERTAQSTQQQPATAHPASSAPPTPAPSAASRAALSESESNYYRAMSIVGGRDPKRMSDGEVAAALNLFLRVQDGPHLAQARRYADQFFEEYQRRKNRR